MTFSICLNVLLNINETKSQRIRIRDHMAIINCPSYPLMLFSAFKGNGHPSPLDDPGKNKIRCTPRGTKVAIYHIVGIFMLNSMHNVVSLATCA